MIVGGKCHGMGSSPWERVLVLIELEADWTQRRPGCSGGEKTLLTAEIVLILQPVSAVLLISGSVAGTSEVQEQLSK